MKPKKDGKKVMGEAGGFIPVLQPTFGDIEEMIRKFRFLFQSHQITVGKYTRELEGEVRSLLGVREVVAVSSCSAGLMMTLKAMRLTGEVILPSFTFAASAHALVWSGLRPVFCDCDEETLTIDVDQIGRLITGQTTAIMPVYIFGSPPEWREIQEIARSHGLRILADAAQGLGAVYQGRNGGAFGDAEVFSMSPTKVITAAEGGLVTTDDRELARRVREMRDYGKAPGGENMAWIGLSARMSEFHAAIALENLRKLEEWTARRRVLIDLYRSELRGIRGIRFPSLPEGNGSSWNYMVILVNDEEAPFSRDELFRWLKGKGIQTKRYFYPPVHQMEVYRRILGRRIPSLPVTEKVSRQALALPLFSHMREETVRTVCRAIRARA